MKNALLFVCAVALVAGAAQAVIIEKYEAEFTSWSGSDGTSTSPVTSSTGHTPAGDFNMLFVGGGSQAPKGTGWLTQGLIGLSPETAKFSHPGAGGSGGGRARFGAELTTSMVGSEGVRVEWRAKYGSYGMGRAPIQIGVTDTGLSGDLPGNVEQNAYIRVQNGTNIDIQRNGGGLYTDIGTLVLPGVGVGDGQFHEWAVEVLCGADGAGHWSLWLDGEKLLFPTVADTNEQMQGAHTYEGVEYSFATFSDSSFSGAPYIGLGEVNTQEMWDFEFDYVRWQNLPEPATLSLLAIGGGLMLRRRPRRS